MGILEILLSNEIETNMNNLLVTYHEALDMIEARTGALPPRTLNWREAQGMTLAEDVHAREPYPPFTNSAMDGYAVRAEDTFAASPDLPVALLVQEEIFAGKAVPRKALHPGYATQIMTGAPVPEGADAVVMVERTRRKDDRVLIFQSARAGENIREKGEELTQGELILFAGEPLGSVELGILAQQGILQVKAIPRPTVAILSTGDEIVEPEEATTGGQIRNTNQYTLGAELKRFGCTTVPLGIAGDDRNQLRKKIEEGLNAADVLLTSGGVSAGEKDYLPSLLTEMGMKTIFHKVSIKPGKPLLFGKIQNKIIFGLPGNVVSVLASFHLFVKPALRRMAGMERWKNPTWYVRYGEPFTNKSGRTNFIRCTLKHSPNGLPIAFPTGRQGSGCYLHAQRPRLRQNPGRPGKPGRI
jgi:molybdopterin molybdotransferase